MLQTRLSSPLTDIKTIHARQDEIESFSGAAPLREALREQLKDVPDMERALARLTIGRATPRDLGMIRDGLRNAETLRALLQKADMPSLEPLTTGLQQNEDCKNSQTFCRQRWKPSFPPKPMKDVLLPQHTMQNSTSSAPCATTANA